MRNFLKNVLIILTLIVIGLFVGSRYYRQEIFFEVYAAEPNNYSGDNNFNDLNLGFGSIGNEWKAEGMENLNLNKGPWEDLWRLLGRIRIFSPNISFKSPNILGFFGFSGNIGSYNDESLMNSDLKFSPNILTSNLKMWWNKINDWCEENIGVSIREILIVVVNIVIWIWELIIGLLRNLISSI